MNLDRNRVSVRNCERLEFVCVGRRVEAGSRLLCDETDDALFDDSGGGDPVEHDENPMSGNGFESEDSLIVPVMCDEGFDLIVEKEKRFLPREDYVSRLRSGEVRLNLRQDGFDWILKWINGLVEMNYKKLDILLCRHGLIL
ncbi:hypothetical protein Droror1_Dr00014637 [Drosera rotundifolia]